VEVSRPQRSIYSKAYLTAGRSRVDKINAEVVTLTYGTIVAQLCRDLTVPNTINKTDYNAVNKELDRMGYNMGLRLIEDFLAKTGTGQCSNFRETAEMISKVGFKVFINITPNVSNWSKDSDSFHLVFEENPLADFVELPDDGRAQDELWYSNILCGVIRGAMEMVRRLFNCCATQLTNVVKIGSDADRSSLRERCVTRRRYDRNACYADTNYRGRDASRRRVTSWPTRTEWSYIWTHDKLSVDGASQPCGTIFNSITIARHLMGIASYNTYHVFWVKKGGVSPYPCMAYGL